MTDHLNFVMSGHVQGDPVSLGNRYPAWLVAEFAIAATVVFLTLLALILTPFYGTVWSVSAVLFFLFLGLAALGWIIRKAEVIRAGA